MEKKEKTKIVEDCSVLETNFVKWCDAERERLASRGKDATKFCALADPDINEGSVCCEDYAFKFNRDEGVIDLVINGEKDSFIWGNVIHCVLPQFASCLGKPETFLYRLSSNTSEKKEFYYFESTDDESGELLPISIDELSPLAAWKAENFDELIANI